ncbi:MAG: D-2-hydroxyacid dehydrogenase [Clostridiales bacterium]|nr:D-2-hydroxyacid dehydrogenase [Clostridiales bacterium]
MQVVVLDGYTLFSGGVDSAPLDALGEIAYYDRTPQDMVAVRIGDAPIVLTNKTKITREVMDACPDLRYIGVLATGYNVVDIEAAHERGIIVTNVPAYSTQAVAQHTMALLLASMSCVHEYDAAVKRGGWSSSPDFCFFAADAQEIAGKTMGIIGFGSIGQAVARAAAGLGMRVLAHTRTPKEGFADVEFVPLHDLLDRSDVISLHCPLTEKTRGIIGKDALAAMKDGVRVINTARGPLVDEYAMAQALESGKVSCYMADVLSTEPPAEGNPLLHAPHTIITPHVAWAPRQTKERLRDIAVANVRAFLDGAPQNAV